MAERQAVVDASVIVRWYLKNSPYLEGALRVRDDYQSGRLDLTAPANMRYEVSAGIHHAIATHTLQTNQVYLGLSEFLKLPIPLVDEPELVLEAHRLSIQLSCSFYDALYLALADGLGVPLIHADNRLRKSLRGRFSGEFWIENY